jgi:hypothetical protein
MYSVLAFLLLPVGLFVLTLCPVLFLFLTLSIVAVIIVHLRHRKYPVISIKKLAYIYAFLAAPYLAISLLSLLIDILRAFLSTLPVPWIKILVVEGLGMALLLYNNFHISNDHKISKVDFFILLEAYD